MVERPQKPLPVVNPAPAALAAVARLRSQTLVQICQTEVERMILDAELEMGARINELALAVRLGISRGPVREACRALVQAGLLETRFNRGFFVRRLTRREVEDIYDLRAGLMRLAAELAAVRIDPAQTERLHAMVGAMARAAGADDIEGFRKLNAEFHAGVIAAADNPRLQQVCDGLGKEIHLFRKRGISSPAAMRHSNSEHGVIVSALARRDPTAAGVAMAEHIHQGKARFLAAAGTEIEARSAPSCDGRRGVSKRKPLRHASRPG